jgi:hypothetical protein
MSNATVQELEGNIGDILKARATEYLPIVTSVIINEDTNRWGNMFLADEDYQIMSISLVHTPAATNADGAVIQLYKTSTTGEFGGSNENGLITTVKHTDEDGVKLRGFDLKATAYTVQNATMTTTAASLLLTAGDRLVWGCNGTMSSTIVSMTTTLKRL